MDEWAQFWDMVESMTGQVEQFFLDVSKDVSETVEALTAVSEEVQEILLGEIEQYLGDLLTPLLENSLGIDQFLGEASQPLMPFVEPTLNQHPTCVGCRHYHGQIYGGQMLVCGMYPYGWEGETCPDWQSAWSD